MKSAWFISFEGIDGAGKIAIINTNGNPYGHVVLRGGDGKRLVNFVVIIVMNNINHQN